MDKYPADGQKIKNSSEDHPQNDKDTYFSLIITEQKAVEHSGGRQPIKHILSVDHPAPMSDQASEDPQNIIG